MHARGTQDRFTERTVAGGHSAHRSAGRRNLSESYDHGERTRPAHGVLQYRGHGMAGGEEAAGGAGRAVKIRDGGGGELRFAPCGEVKGGPAPSGSDVAV